MKLLETCPKIHNTGAWDSGRQAAITPGPIMRTSHVRCEKCVGKTLWKKCRENVKMTGS